jgi:hypothetical protein
MKPAWMAAAAVATAGGLVLLAWASAAPLPHHSPGMARLRLSWSARPERIEVCRQISAEELARRAEHMRQRLECDGVFATYLLRVAIDDRSIGEAVIHGSGLRYDRPLYLLRDYPVPPGVHQVRVTLTRREAVDTGRTESLEVHEEETDTGLFAGRAEREATERTRRRHAAIPPALALDRRVTFAPGQVVLVIFQAEHRQLELRTGSASR